MPYVYPTIIFYMLHYILLYKSLIQRRFLIILITVADLVGLLVDFKNLIISGRLKTLYIPFSTMYCTDVCN